MRKVRVIKCVIKGESIHDLYDLQIPICFHFYLSQDPAYNTIFPSVCVMRGKDPSRTPVCDRYIRFTGNFMVYHTYEETKERRKRKSSGLRV